MDDGAFSRDIIRANPVFSKCSLSVALHSSKNPTCPAFYDYSY